MVDHITAERYRGVSKEKYTLSYRRHMTAHGPLSKGKDTQFTNLMSILNK